MMTWTQKLFVLLAALGLLAIPVESRSDSIEHIEQGVACHPGNEPTRLIKIGDETFEITVKNIFFLQPCTDAPEHTVLILAGVFPEINSGISLSAWERDKHLLQLAEQYLKGLEGPDRLTDSNELIEWPEPPTYTPRDLRLIGLDTDGHVLTVIQCPEQKVFTWCQGNSNFHNAVLSYGFERTTLHDWRKWDIRAREYVSSLVRTP
jgi:hypothetical protein